MSIAHLVPKDLRPSPEHADALLELAYLVTAADGKLADEEIVAFTEIAARLHGKERMFADIDALFDRYASHIEYDAIVGRLREVVTTLPPEFHELAYKLALALAFVDQDPSEEEDKLHAILGEALGLSPERREALSREITFGRPEPEASPGA
jgi:tellurite resistance protein